MSDATRKVSLSSRLIEMLHRFDLADPVARLVAADFVTDHLPGDVGEVVAGVLRQGQDSPIPRQDRPRIDHSTLIAGITHEWRLDLVLRHQDRLQWMALSLDCLKVLALAPTLQGVTRLALSGKKVRRHLLPGELAELIRRTALHEVGFAVACETSVACLERDRALALGRPVARRADWTVNGGLDSCGGAAACRALEMLPS